MLTGACPDDATPADKAIAFLETLKIPEGPKAGQPMRLAQPGTYQPYRVAQQQPRMGFFGGFGTW